MNDPYVAGGAHFSPLTGEMGGSTGQRPESSRDSEAEGVSFGPEPDRGVVLGRLGQGDQVVEGRVERSRSELRDGSRWGSADASTRSFSAAFELSGLLRGSSGGGGTPNAGRGERGWLGLGSGWRISGGAVVLAEGGKRLDCTGREEAEGGTTGGGRSGEKQALLACSDSPIPAARQRIRNII